MKIDRFLVMFAYVLIVAFSQYSFAVQYELDLSNPRAAEAYRRALTDEDPQLMIELSKIEGSGVVVVTIGEQLMDFPSGMGQMTCGQTTEQAAVCMDEVD